MIHLVFYSIFFKQDETAVLFLQSVFVSPFISLTTKQPTHAAIFLFHFLPLFLSLSLSIYIYIYIHHHHHHQVSLTVRLVCLHFSCIAPHVLNVLRGWFMTFETGYRIAVFLWSVTSKICSTWHGPSFGSSHLYFYQYILVAFMLCIYIIG